MLICKFTDQIRIFQINQSIPIIDGSTNLLIFEHIFIRQIGVKDLTNTVIKSRRQEQIHNLYISCYMKSGYFVFCRLIKYYTSIIDT